MNAYILKSIISGVLRGILLYAIDEYCLSVYFAKSSVLDIAILAICIAISSICSVAFMRGKQNKKVVLNYVIGLCSFLLVLALIFTNHMSLGLELIPHRELGDADGFFIILMDGAYIVFTAIVRIVVLIVNIVKNDKNGSGLKQ